MKSQQRSRRRGVILTPQGLQKLQDAKSQSENNENFGQRYTREALGFQMKLDPDTVAKVFTCEVGVDRQTLNYCFSAFNLKLEPQDYQFANSHQSLENFNTQIQNPKSVLKSLLNVGEPPSGFTTLLIPGNPSTASGSPHATFVFDTLCERKIRNSPDWGEAPDVSLFCGRSEEQRTLKQWILNEAPANKAIPCRFLTLLGMGGMGKTWLSVKLSQQLQDKFEFVIWRSLSLRPALTDLLSDLIACLANEQNPNLPDSLHSRMSRFIDYLQHHRCLLVLDGAEAVLQDCATYQSVCGSCVCFPEKEEQEYREFFKRLGEVAHESCVILTSRDKPKEITALEGEIRPVRVFHLHGLQIPDVQQLFHAKGNFAGTRENWQHLVEFYAGNPLALNLVSTTIQNLFAGNIGEFLQQQTPIFGEISNLLAQQWECLSDTAKEILQSLAFHCQPISFKELRSQLASSMSNQILFTTLESLQARSLIETKSATFSLHPLVMEYVNSQLITENNLQIKHSLLLEQKHLLQIAS